MVLCFDVLLEIMIKQQLSHCRQLSKWDTNVMVGDFVWEVNENMKKNKNSYLVIWLGILCCINKPDCPPNLVPQVPIKPYQMYCLKKSVWVCITTSEVKKKKTTITLYAVTSILATVLGSMILAHLYCVFTRYKILKVFSGNPLFADRWYWCFIGDLFILLKHDYFFMFFGCVTYMYTYFRLHIW